MLEACTTPDLVAEITAQPVRRYGVDAGIFYSDIVVPLYLAGVDVTIETGVGPVFADPVCDDAALARLTAHEPADLDVIIEAARLASAAIPVPLIGFAGAPFTLAAYAVEGRSSRDHLAARTLMHARPASWDRLMTWMADQSGAFLAAQVAGGAQAVQLFDSWAGSLSAADYRRFVLPYSARTLAWVRGQVPVVHFGTGTGEFLTALAEAGADVVGVDHRIPLDEASRRLGGATPVQGNIDPALLGGTVGGAGDPRPRCGGAGGGSSDTRGQSRPRSTTDHEPGRPDPSRRTGAHAVTIRITGEPRRAGVFATAARGQLPRRRRPCPK